jgi:single-stranded-DNA-specific exonuclease
MDISNQELIADRQIMIQRLAEAIRLGQLVVIIGDYDVDGGGSTALFTQAIREMGGRVAPILASRFNGAGYGFSDLLCDKALALSPSVILTCDCGGSDGPRVERATAAGVDVLVLDHHVVPQEKLNAMAFINPNRPDCKSEFKFACSGILSLSVIGGLRRLLKRSDIKLSDYYDIAALTAVADVVNLSGDCRIIAREGLSAISKGTRPGIRALLEINNIPIGTTLTARDLGFRICPALNAPGRLGPPDIILDLLLARDIDDARRIAAEIKILWDRRRTITEEMTEEAISRISVEEASSSALCVGSPEWSHGIVGIVAARLVDKFKVPVCVVGHEGRGSLRGPPGSRLYDALVYCSDTLLRFGGHQAAAGNQLAWENLEAFRQKFNEFFTLNPPVPPADQFDPILEIDLEDDLLTLSDQLFLLEPCGQGNIRPTLQTSGTIKSWKLVKGDHLKFDILLSNGQLLPCFKIKPAEGPETLTNGQKITVQGDLRKNTWNGKTKAEMFVNTIL